MTESTQQPDLSKAAPEVDTLLLAVNAALDKMGGMNIPDDPFEQLAWLHDFARVLEADRAKELEADARRYRWLTSDAAEEHEPAFAVCREYGGRFAAMYGIDADAAIDRAQGEQA